MTAFLEAAAFLGAVGFLGGAAGFVLGELRGIRIGRDRAARDPDGQ